MEEHITAEVVTPEDPLGLTDASVFPSLVEHIVLQVTFPRLIADGAVERVVRQVEFQDAPPHPQCGLTLRVHHLTCRYFRRAGRE